MNELKWRTCQKCGEEHVFSSELRCVGCRALPLLKRLKELGWENGVVYVDGLSVGKKA